jgi:hypothetical protein
MASLRSIGCLVGNSKHDSANRISLLKCGRRCTTARSGASFVNLPRHLKSLLASVAFPAWCLGHDPSTQILCVSYAQDLADKLTEGRCMRQRR